MAYQRINRSTSNSRGPSQAQAERTESTIVKVFNPREEAGTVKTLNDATVIGGFIGRKDVKQLAELIQELAHTDSGIGFKLFLGEGKESGELESFMIFRNPGSGAGNGNTQTSRFGNRSRGGSNRGSSARTTELAGKTIEEDFR